MICYHMKNLTNSMQHSPLEKLTITPIVKKFHAIRHKHIKKYAYMYNMLELIRYLHCALIC
jgi:hypothetical protein